MGKLGSNVKIGDALESPFEIIVDIRNDEKYAIQLVYGSGTGPSAAKLQASLNYNPDDESGDWTDIEGSSQELDDAGGVHMWNVSNAIYPWVKVVTTGDADPVDVFCAKDPQPRRG